MKKILTLLILLLTTPVYASFITGDTVYTTNDSVTATKLNNDNTVVKNVVNGGLDNTNADTSSGFRFVEVLGSLPTAGTQGRVVFLTTDNSLNLDTGSAFSKFEQMPEGMIMLWSGTIASIPTGWELSDGSCSITCPDLTNRFIVGADADDSGAAKSTITGVADQEYDASDVDSASVTLTAAQSGVGAHTHTAPIGSSGGGSLAGSTGYSAGQEELEGTTGSTSASASSGHDHSISNAKHIPSFYALAYVIKVN